MSSSVAERGAQAPTSMSPEQFEAYAAECLQLVRERITQFIPSNTRLQTELYDLVMDYPLRDAKGLRPALCLAVCRGLGGSVHAALPSAAVLELYHNAFLVHDDVEDGSEQRRGGPTLHDKVGAPIAINVADAMLALSLKPLLDNTELIGLGRALKVLTAISDMSLTSVEGQAMELHWVRNGLPVEADELYVEMVQKKTAHYSFMAPLDIGAIIAGAEDTQRAELRALGLALGVAFQIQDDLLNLDPGQGYGKEQAGDLWEGKYTLALLHALRVCDPEHREKALTILAKPRPTSTAAAAANVGNQPEPSAKTATDVEWLRQLIAEHRGSEHALLTARSWAQRAAHRFEGLRSWFPASRHRDFIAHVVDYVVTRTR